VSELIASDRLARSVSRVTSAMLGRTFGVSAAKSPIALWRTVVLPIPGKRPMTVALSSDRSGCATLASAMLGMAEADIGVDMIDDFMRELLNMTAGQIKLELSLDQALGLPRVRDGEVLFAQPPEWAHCTLNSGSIQLVVSLVAALV
jgi:hypothetical protein